jgi:hypothetical protein
MSTAFERVLAKRAKRLGVSLEEAAKPPQGKPLYLLAAEKTAERRGITVEAVLQEDLKQLMDASYDFSCYEED